MRPRTTRWAGAALGFACFVTPTAIVTSAADAATNTPSLVMNDGQGGIWSLRAAGTTKGMHNYAGTDDVSNLGCSYTATASRINLPGTGTWSWTFDATLVSGGCVKSVHLQGTGIGAITGTFDNGFAVTPWTGTITKGAGTP